MDMATPDSHSIVVLFGKPDGTFASPQAQQIGSTIGYVQVADVNGDHIPDLLTSNDLVFARGRFQLLQLEFHLVKEPRLAF